MPPDAVLSQGLQFEIAARVETVNRFDQSNRTRGDQVIKVNLWTASMQPKCKKPHLRHVGKDQLFAM